MTSNFAAVKAAAVDGRAHTIFHRQTQLEKLHDALRQEAAAIQDAIVADNASTRGEAAVEYYAAMKCVSDAYHSLRPIEALAQEYSVANGRDDPANREPVGVVYIEPTRHTLFYSLISPVSSAIVAGNCVVVLLERNLRNSSTVLRRVLTSALEKDSFTIADKPAAEDLPASKTIFVLQESDEQLPRPNQLVSVASPSVAMVDRSANLQHAAKELVAATFAFGGRSPYAPDVVLVNELVLKDFLCAVVQECVSYGSTSFTLAIRGIEKDTKNHTNEVTNGIETLRSTDPGLRIIVQEAKYAVVETTSRQHLLSKRLSGAILNVHSIRSLDDGIDLVRSRILGACSAAYHFGTAETGKYLCQFLPSTVSFVNHVPRELLLGPLGPQHHPVDLANRYPATLFTVPRPQYIIPTAESQKLAVVLATSDNAGAGQLMADASKQLAVLKRGSGKGMGFFEQGFLMNASLILVGTIVASVAGIYTIYTRSRFI